MTSALPKQILWSLCGAFSYYCSLVLQSGNAYVFRNPGEYMTVFLTDVYLVAWSGNLLYWQLFNLCCVSLTDLKRNAIFLNGFWTLWLPSFISSLEIWSVLPWVKCGYAVCSFLLLLLVQVALVALFTLWMEYPFFFSENALSMFSGLVWPVTDRFDVIH
jgi:hypothetical protein